MTKRFLPKTPLPWWERVGVRGIGFTVLILSCIACGGTSDNGGENFGNLLESASGLTLTAAEHEGGWGRGDCTVCHTLEDIHLVDRTGTNIDIQTIHNDAIRDGETGCSNCHGTNGAP